MANLNKISTKQQNRKISFLVNPKIIQSAISKGYVNEICFYYLLKLNFKYSHISNINRPKERISKLTGLSINTISKYLHKLHFLGYIQPDSNGWVINTFKGNARDKKYNRITASLKPTLNELRDLLYLKVLERKGNGQSKFNSLGTYIDGIKGIELPINRKSDTTSYKPYFSVRYVARILNLSTSTAFQLLHHLMDAGYLKQHYEGAGLVCLGGNPDYLDDLYDYKYIQNSGMYRVEPARYEFLVNPIKQKDLTLKEYRRLSKYPNIRKYIDYRNLLNIRLSA